VLHVSPWMADGIEDEETPDGAALFERLCQDINANVRPFFQKWRPGDMVIWDNWRLLHCSTGVAPTATRSMHRTTIKGDYGLGSFENNASGESILADTEV
jgi:taurine dioxygenase